MMIKTIVILPIHNPAFGTASEVVVINAITIQYALAVSHCLVDEIELCLGSPVPFSVPEIGNIRKC